MKNKKLHIDDYQKYRTTHKIDGFELPHQSILNGDIKLNLSLNIPRKRIEEVLGISLDLVKDEYHKDQSKLDKHISNLIYDGIFKYSLPFMESTEKMMRMVSTIFVDVFEECLQRNQFQRFLKENIENPPYHKLDIEPPKGHICIGCDDELLKEHNEKLKIDKEVN